MSAVSARIERLPFGKYHRHLLLLGGLGYAFDAMDAAVIAFVLPVLKSSWQLDGPQLGIVASANFIGFFFGALSAGALGDLIGRRRIMMWALVVYCVASFFSAMTNEWSHFIALRIIAGIGTGAESAIIAPYLSEFVPRRYRGIFTGALAGFFSFGFIAAALLGRYIITPDFEQGWRVVILITSTPVLMLLWWRRRLLESPRWLESQGRTDEALEVVAKMEQQVMREFAVLPPVDAEELDAPPPVVKQESLFAKYAFLLSKKLRPITIMTWCMWLSITFCYYSFFSWIPTLLIQNGMTLTKSFTYALVMYIAQTPGYFSAAWFNEKIGRQATVVSYMVLGSLAAIGMAYARSDAQVMTMGILLSFFMNGAYAGIYAYTPEVFPTHVRTIGTGLASAIGRIGGISAPIMVGFTYEAYGFIGVFGATTVILFLGAGAVLIMGIPTKGKSLEQIAASKLS
ncbi:MFS transporter [Verminephrobacter eiseniae]|uniref:MFS transporter n=1 Tax=Verminephrobacter eiseniae TaxID=364317 RepID=UPI0022386799|nr:MFS transporter [Verminephrobacter eiseniae]MCW5235163.1 MFS transporter [Verminephrobacter eiseniae]